jgi:chromosome segregation ATPase
MKIKILLSGLCAVLVLAGCGKEAEQARQKAETELHAAQAELEQLRTSQANFQAELERLRKDNQELLRLRNEVRQVRDEKLLLQKQVQNAQTALVGAQAESQRIQAQVQALSQPRTPAAVQVLPTSAEVLNACINNLRMIDAAKQQWALENQKPAEAQPAVQDLAPYLKDSVFPACPAAGKYVINAVGVVPTCSVAGHTLAQ